MIKFSINFWNPWLLLLLIPAFVFTLFSYFKLNKRYRFTRNRIVSITLHLIIMVFSIAVLAGMTFSYYVKNTENEVILLVDASYSTSEDSGDEVDEFIRAVIAESNNSFKLGIVTFGYDQVLAANLTSRTDGLYAAYSTSPKPNTTATDISSAIQYASKLFKTPQSARIVLISDAIETDGNAAATIKSVAAKGIKVDTVYFPGEDVGNEVQIIGMDTSEKKIGVGTNFNIDLKLQSSFAGVATITPYDNGVAGEDIKIPISTGVQTVSIPYSFTLPGMHQMSFELTSNGDNMVQNNSYVSYIYLEIHENILIIESIHNESQALTDMLEKELKVTIINSGDSDKMPTTIEQLRNYDEIILCNVANNDLPAGFDQLLYSYVKDIGGGLFAICGNKENSDSANAYTYEDMKHSIYQEMLPVEIVEYTPPAAVMILIDISGSMMTGEYNKSRLYYAIQGAISSIDALTERDYVGVMTLSDSFEQVAELTPVPQKDKILASIYDLEQSIIEDYKGGNTVFSIALERAGKELSANTSVQKKHIIIVTDGEPSSDDAPDYKRAFETNRDLGITTSIIGIECTAGAEALMKELLVNHAGPASADNFHNTSKVTNLPQVMRQELAYGDIKEMNYKEFVPKINAVTTVTSGISQEDMPALTGYYGVKLKDGAQAILMGEYSPIYSQWQFGNGRVGVFACDLNGTWSAEVVSSEAGSLLVNNIIATLFPAGNIRLKEIEAEVIGDNYSNTLSVFTELGKDEYIQATITSPPNENGESSVQVLKAGASDGYTRIPFSVTTAGLHEILVEKKSASGETLVYTTVYKALSYSKEYDAFADTTAAATLAIQLAELSGGYVLNEPAEVFDNAVEYLHKVIDPKLVLITAVIVLFLIDIAARKFKWKWPHEIIRDKKTKALSGKKTDSKGV